MDVFARMHAGFREEWKEKDWDDSLWPLVRLPYPGEESELTLRLSLASPSRPGWERVLRLSRPVGRTTVWADGKEIGRCSLSWLPAEFPLPPEASAIAIRCETGVGRKKTGAEPGGFIGSASLQERPSRHISFLRVRTNGPEKVTISLETTGDGPFSASVSDGKKEIGRAEGVTEGGKGQVAVSVSTILAWDLRHPRLYTARVVFGEDAKETVFGHREASFAYRGFLLRGRLCQLVGMVRGDCRPFLGYCTSPACAREEVRRLKSCGVNFIRTQGHPASEEFLDACDAEGLFVEEDLPSDIAFSGREDEKEKKTACVRSLVRRDCNHPSVILYGIGDGGEDEDLSASLADAVRESAGGVQSAAGMPAEGHRFHADVLSVSDRAENGLEDPVSASPYMVGSACAGLSLSRRDGWRMGRIQFLRHIAILESAFANDRITACLTAGAADCEEGKGGCGLYDAWCTPKFGAYAYISQQDAPLVVATDSALSGGGRLSERLPLVIATNCESVRLLRDGKEVGVFWPSRETWPHVPHPPVLVHNPLGDDPRIGKRLRKVLAALDEERIKTSLLRSRSLDSVLHAHGLGGFSGRREIARWKEILDSEKSAWTIEGLVKGKVVAVHEEGGKPVKCLTLQGTQDGVKEGDFLFLPFWISQKGSILPDGSERSSFTVAVDGPADLLSPRSGTLDDGSSAAVLRITGKGSVRVQVSAGGLSAQTEVACG